MSGNDPPQEQSTIPDYFPPWQVVKSGKKGKSLLIPLIPTRNSFNVLDECSKGIQSQEQMEIAIRADAQPQNKELGPKPLPIFIHGVKVYKEMFLAIQKYVNLNTLLTKLKLIWLKLM